MYGIYANIGGILMANVTIYSIHGSYGVGCKWETMGNSRKIYGSIWINMGKHGGGTQLSMEHMGGSEGMRDPQVAMAFI